MSEEKLLSELQLLTSMYSSSDIHFHDPEILFKIENSIPISESVSMTLKVNEGLEINLRIPSGYQEGTAISAHCSVKACVKGENVLEKLTQLNNDLLPVTKNGINGEPCDILSVINWCNEQWERLSHELFESSIQKDTQSEIEPPVITICRIWIHSHHIYNEKKRKFLVENASNLGLSGFSLPGKPGFICVEGISQNCDEFWSRVRQLTWQKISLIEREIVNESEKAFGPNDFTELLVDKSIFMKYLNDKGISSVIKGYLGF